jgi:hypothetical protein
VNTWSACEKVSATTGSRAQECAIPGTRRLHIIYGMLLPINREEYEVICTDEPVAQTVAVTEQPSDATTAIDGSRTTPVSVARSTCAETSAGRENQSQNKDETLHVCSLG